MFELHGVNWSVALIECRGPILNGGIFAQKDKNTFYTISVIIKIENIYSIKKLVQVCSVHNNMAMKARNMGLKMQSKLVQQNMCLLLLLLNIFLTQTNFGKQFFAQSRSFDDGDYCQLKLYRRQHFTDPKPKAVEHNTRHLKLFQIKSVRSIGRFEIKMKHLTKLCYRWLLHLKLS